MEKITYNVMGYHEFDTLVNQHVPSASGEYEFLAMEESPNDICRRFHGVKSIMEDRFAKEYGLPEIMAGKLQYHASTLLAYLCFLDVIEPGDYLIEVSW